MRARARKVILYVLGIGEAGSSGEKQVKNFKMKKTKKIDQVVRDYNRSQDLSKMDSVLIKVVSMAVLSIIVAAGTL